MVQEEAAIQEKVVQVLQENTVMNVATQGDEGPWCNTLYFVEEGFDLLCLVESGGRTMANLKRNHRVAVTINRQTPDRFLQGSGTAYVIGPPLSTRQSRSKPSSTKDRVLHQGPSSPWVATFMTVFSCRT
jgi:hypothetical protein